MKKRRTPMQAIRAKCKDCTRNQWKKIRECRTRTCALWPYRMGIRPKDDHEDQLALIQLQGDKDHAAVTVS